MKNILKAIVMFLSFCILVSCSKDFKVTYLEICPSEMTTTINDTVQMSDSGIIVTKAAGNADITVSCQSINSTCNVEVIDTADQEPILPYQRQ